MKKLKLTELNKNEKLGKEALSVIRGGSGDTIPCCCSGSTRAWRKTSGWVNEERKELESSRF